MKKICILHFQPVEKYPPTINLVRLLANTDTTRHEIHLFTTDPGIGKENIIIPGVQIHRIGKSSKGTNRISRLLFYAQFVLSSLFWLLKYKPAVLLYYETVSAGAPYFYKKWLNPSCDLFIHYHEYTSPEEYKTGMIFNRWLHSLELSLYNKACWVSHTNADRMNLFLKDTGKSAPLHHFILPNHPPESWAKNNKKKNDVQADLPIGFVYVGALSLEHLYIQEMAKWIAGKPKECYWDIYSDNIAPGVLDYLATLNASNIIFKGAASYDDLPTILSQYSIGTILYKGHIPNYIYNVPNKLFEYHVCGLDTWFPSQMISCLPLVTRDTYPKVVAIDFTKMDSLSLEDLTSIQEARYDRNEYSCEKTYLELIELINKP